MENMEKSPGRAERMRRLIGSDRPIVFVKVGALSALADPACGVLVRNHPNSANEYSIAFGNHDGPGQQAHKIAQVTSAATTPATKRKTMART
jgi:hypothetical protein